LALIVGLVSTTPVVAQTTTASVGLLRRVSGVHEGIAVSGFRAAVSHEGRLRDSIRMQVEAGFSQLSIVRTFPAGRGRVNQNAVDLAAVLLHPLASRARLSVGVGAVVSRGLGCGTASTLSAPRDVVCPDPDRSAGAVWSGAVALLRSTVDINDIRVVPELRWLGDAILIRVGIGTR